MRTTDFLNELKEIFGKENVLTKGEALKDYSFDKCPRNLFLDKLRNTLESSSICLTVVKPTPKHYKKELTELVKLARKYGKKIIPRGGGSGVCGALVPRDGPNTVIVDMTPLDIKYEINLMENYVIVGSGIIGSELEGYINDANRTIGHSPASLSISTPGGWVATRSSGQFSALYGTIEDLVQGIEVVTANGRMDWIWGEKLKLFFRMEGTTGIITKVKMKMFHLPRHRRFFAFSFKNLSYGLWAMRFLFKRKFSFEKRGVNLAALRLYDPIDYMFVAKPFKAHSSEKKGKFTLEKILMSYPRFVNSLNNFLGKRNFLKYMLLIVLESDSSDELSKAAKDFNLICNGKNGGKREDGKIAEIWHKNRFKLNYEKLLKRFEEGIIIDTFDCRPESFYLASKVYQAVVMSVKDTVIISAHFGMDKEGPCIYFTFAGTEKGWAKRFHLYDIVWQKILDACIQNGGLTTHHHGVGSLKAGPANCLVSDAYGRDWLNETAKPAKENLDPDNIFNPGNLV